MTEPTSGYLRVFISWSLPLAESIAGILRDWLPRVIQSVKPFVSSEDLEKGKWWNREIIEKLQGSEVGIVIVTPANVERPWLNFEAGALARAIELRDGIVAPLLINVPSVNIQAGPLGSLQAVRFDKADMLKLMKTINERAKPRSLAEGFLREEFEEKWPRLDARVNAAIEEAVQRNPEANAEPTRRDTNLVLEDLVDAVRTIPDEVAARLSMAEGHGRRSQEVAVKRYVGNAFAEAGLEVDGIDVGEENSDGSLPVAVYLAGDPVQYQRAMNQAITKLRAVRKYDLSVGRAISSG